MPVLASDPDFTEDHLLTLASLLEVLADSHDPSGLSAALRDAARVTRRWLGTRQIVSETRGALNVDPRMSDLDVVQIMATYAIALEVQHQGASRHVVAGTDVPAPASDADGVTASTIRRERKKAQRWPTS